jgi:uncharacterized protein (DUF1697 family)
MSTCVALLRGVNVGGQKLVPMAKLRELAAELGLSDPRTLLQSGNLVFRTRTRRTADLEASLERAIHEGLGVETRVLVRTAEEWSAAVESNPFHDEAVRDPGHLLLHVMKAAPSRAGVDALVAAVAGRERVHVHGRHAYLVYPDGVGRSKLTISVLERHLAAAGTARNWNTVLKLRALMSE